MIPEGEDLLTEEGRAEILLNPGAFLRLAEKTGVRMLSNRLLEPRIEVLSGSVILENAGATDDSNIAISVGDTEVNVSRRGIYSLDSGSRLLKVVAGLATVTCGQQTLSVDSNTQLRFKAAPLAVEKLRLNPEDPFVRWAVLRSDAIALDNCLSAARIHHRKNGATRSGFWYHDSVHGTAYLPSRDYCTGFLGPLGVLEANGW